MFVFVQKLNNSNYDAKLAATWIQVRVDACSVVSSHQILVKKAIFFLWKYQPLLTKVKMYYDKDLPQLAKDRVDTQT